MAVMAAPKDGFGGEAGRASWEPSRACQGCQTRGYACKPCSHFQKATCLSSLRRFWEEFRTPGPQKQESNTIYSGIISLHQPWRRASECSIHLSTQADWIFRRVFSHQLGQIWSYIQKKWKEGSKHSKSNIWMEEFLGGAELVSALGQCSGGAFVP